MPRLPLVTLCFTLAAFPAGAAVVVLDPEIVTAARTPQPPEQVAATLHVLNGETLRNAPSATLDGALRSVPGFSLFRRSDSLTANPTAQGVSLRGLGPSGASRSLVLLDGVPLNDPFGGWIAWTKVPRETLLGIEIVPGGGATAWGNAALGGVIQVRTEEPGARASRVTAMGGDYGTRSLDLLHAQPVGAKGHLALSGRIFATDGFRLVAPEDRGPIDVPAWNRHRWLSGRWRQAISDTLSVGAMFRIYEETRSNGTPYQRNASREKFLSLSAAGQPAEGFAWQATVYGQDQSFASTFGAVNATRTIETPASDQYSVPSEAVGAAWTGAWRHANTARTSIGADARFVRGETREHFTFAAGSFTRRRIAGGEQQVAGIFSLHERPVARDVRLTFGARLDAWGEGDGHRRETDLLTGAILRDDRYADRSGTAFSPSVGAVWMPSPAWRLRANAQRSFRRPTLNELYRPFRVGPNVTEANAALATERVTSGELAAEWRLFPAAVPTAMGNPRARLSFTAAAFWNDLRDAVGNVTLARGPGTFPVVGFVAAGGVGRQRLNLDRSRVRGVELSARWHVAPAAALTADFLYNDATIVRSALAPSLVGKRIAQVPRHSASFGAQLTAPAEVQIAPRVRWLGRQFEDDENQLVLGETVVADITVRRRFGAAEVFVTVENLGNARIETGRTVDGIVNTGTPRLFLAGVRGTW